MYYMPHFSLGMRWPLIKIAKQVLEYTKPDHTIADALFTWPIGYVLGDERTGEMRFHFDGPCVRVTNTLTKKEILAEKVTISAFLGLANDTLSRQGLSDKSEAVISALCHACQDTYWDSTEEFVAWQRAFYEKGNLEKQGYRYAW